MLVRYTEAFKRQLRRLSRKYRHIRVDVGPIVVLLESGETPGDRIQGLVGYRIYKVRVKNSDTQRGKSGGYRLIYYLPRKEEVILVAIYSKVEQSDLAMDEVKRIVEQEDNQ